MILALLATSGDLRIELVWQAMAGTQIVDGTSRKALLLKTEFVGFCIV